MNRKVYVNIFFAGVFALIFCWLLGEYFLQQQDKVSMRNGERIGADMLLPRVRKKPPTTALTSSPPFPIALDGSASGSSANVLIGVPYAPSIQTIILDAISDDRIEVILPTGVTIILPVKLLAENKEFQTMLMLLEKQQEQK